METQNITLIETLNAEVLSINFRLQFVEAVEEEGLMEIYYQYDIHKDWIEIAEGGFVVESGYEYLPKNISIVKIIHEKFGELSPSYLDESTLTNIINYISDEVYQEENGIN